MKFKIYKKIRVIIALFFFMATLFSFIDIYELLPESYSKGVLFFQFAPSLFKFLEVIAWSTFGFSVILILSIFIGRFYCSSICPLGIIQDFFAFIARKRNKKKVFYKYKKPHSIIRYSLLTLIVLAYITGVSIVISLLEPYSNAGRIFTYSIQPILISVNNLLASILNELGVYRIYPIPQASPPLFISLYTICFFLLITYLSYKRGRLFCNMICPVGTLLGLFSKKSVYKINIIPENCTKCGKCSSNCKSECIDLKSQEIDYSRCISCFNCLPVCNDKAIDFSLYKAPRIEKSSNKTGEKTYNRRNAIATLLTLSASSTILAQKIKNTPNPKHTYLLSLRKHPISPPGSQSTERFNKLCTACGLCISACPTNVLQPALKEYGLIGFMQPYMDYAHSGFCNFDCNRCGEICPTGAILPIDISKKQITQLGKAIFVQQNCVVHTDETDCGACSEHCPTKAVNMVPYKNDLVIPEVNKDICIGCGACEHPCPIEYPNKAIYVEGNPIHEIAKKPIEEQSLQQQWEDDFPF
jgi:ferredoxin